MVMKIYPKVPLNGPEYKSVSGVNSDLRLAQGYWPRYHNGTPPEPGDIPESIKVSYRHDLPDAMANGEMWVISPRLLDFIQEANGPDWVLHSTQILLRTKAGDETPCRFLWGPPRSHRYNHDERTYPHPKKPSLRNDGVAWAKPLGGDISPNGRTMRPSRLSDPQFWEDIWEIDGDTLWSGGERRSKYVSDRFWTSLNSTFPNMFKAKPIAEKDLSRFV